MYNAYMHCNYYYYHTDYDAFVHLIASSTVETEIYTRFTSIPILQFVFENFQIINKILMNFGCWLKLVKWMPTVSGYVWICPYLWECVCICACVCVHPKELTRCNSTTKNGQQCVECEYYKYNRKCTCIILHFQ